MNEQEQIRAIAEMDGFNPEPELAVNAVFGKAHNKPKWSFINQLPPYLTSRDAIVECIIRLKSLNTSEFVNCLLDVLDIRDDQSPEPSEMFNFATASPPQFCEALLRATGKWKP